ncbi:MAG: rod shape-determining protein MreD [Candidatus Doudnabacteria bacterium]|nr:rod shape-determining protein MreD [Candidatus Doudnabacteria bacterium]
MYKNIGYLFLAFLLYALNAGFFRNFEFFGVLPNLLLLLLVYTALEDEDYFFLGFGFFTGLVLDFATQVFVGSFALGFLFAALLLRQISQNIISLERNWKFLPLMLGVAQLVVYAWIFFLNGLAHRFGHAQVFFEAKYLLNRFGWEFLYNLALMYPVWKLAEIPKVLQVKFSGRIK